MPELANIYPKPIIHKVDKLITVVDKLTIETEIYALNPYSIIGYDNVNMINVLIGTAIIIKNIFDIRTSELPAYTTLSSDIGGDIHVETSSS